MKHITLILLIIFSSISIAKDSDPFEGINRTIFNFNTALDKNFIEPIARSYDEHTPKIIRLGVSNFFANLQEVPTFANQVLQLKLTSAVDTAIRFTFNSTLGLAGVIDVATDMGFKKGREDFGQTLGFYGFSSGPYLVLPILGPSSLRDVTIIPVDSYAQADLHLSNREAIAKNLMFGVNVRANFLPKTDLMYDSSDPYTTIRSSYLQNREYLIRDGKIEAKDIDF